jgi:hypothetical protein
MKTGKILVAILSLSVFSCLMGCSHDSDPEAKVDAPGYYNGPMGAKGQGSAAAAAPAKKAPAAPAID